MTGTISSKARVIRKKVVGETEEYIAITLYLLVVFSALLFLKSAILRSQGVIWVPWGFAAVKAAVAAKFILIGRAMRFGNGFRAKPLIWQAAYRSLAFLLVVAGLTVIEEATVGLINGRAFRDSMAAIGGGTPEQLAATAVILFLVFLPLSAFEVLGEVMGKTTLFRLFFIDRGSFEQADRRAEDESAHSFNRSGIRGVEKSSTEIQRDSGKPPP